MHNEFVKPTIKNSSVHIHVSLGRAMHARMSDWHIHRQFELYAQLKSEKDFYVGNFLYRLSEGDIILVNKQIPHKTVTPEGSGGLYIQFDTDIFGGFENFDKSNPLAHFWHFANDNATLFKHGSEENQALFDSVLNILRENNGQNEFYEMFIRAEVYKIIAQLFRFRAIKAFDTSYKIQAQTTLNPIFEYTLKHFKENVSLSQISAVAGLDKTYFCRLFKKSTGISFLHYLNLVRISAAEKMLISTDKTISEISYETGFSSSSYFAETFKKYRGCSPSLYKKLTLGK